MSLFTLKSWNETKAKSRVIRHLVGSPSHFSPVRVWSHPVPWLMAKTPPILRESYRNPVTRGIPKKMSSFTVRWCLFFLFSPFFKTFSPFSPSFCFPFSFFFPIFSPEKNGEKRKEKKRKKRWKKGFFLKLCTSSNVGLHQCFTNRGGGGGCSSSGFTHRYLGKLPGAQI